jgi:threonine-phosphate decarboxylase
MTTYQHGGDQYEFAQKANCLIEDIIDLSSNINFVKPSIDIDFNNLDISAYPNYDKLYKSIAQHYKISQNEMELFNGASSAIFSLFKHLNLSHCTLYSPAYLEYKRASLVFNYDLCIIDRLIDLSAKVTPNSLVVFVNPSTPDGVFYNIDNLIQKWIKAKCTILIDESFLEFTPFHSALPLIQDYDKLYILKSMTKFYGSAGIRIGAIISNEKNIKKLKQKEPAWKISQFDSHYIQEALKDKNFINLSAKENNNNKEQLIKILEASTLIQKVFPSSANYILVKLNTLSAKAFQEHLLPFKIMIRDCSNFDGLDDRFVRIAVKDIKSINTLKKAL